MTQVVEEEVKEMPITVDIRENKQSVLRRLLEGRFGPLPVWAVERIEGAGTASLEA